MLGLLSVTALAQSSNTPPQPRPQQPQVDPSSVSDDELKKFADATKAAREVRQNARKEIEKAVNDGGMEMSRFRKIMMQKRQQRAQQQGQQQGQGSAQKVEVTPEEEQKLQKIQKDIMAVQQKTNKKMRKKIKDSGMEVKRYQEIRTAVQQSPELMEKLQTMMQEGASG